MGSSNAFQELIRFKREMRVKNTINIAGCTILGLLSIILFMMIAGPTFDPILNSLGLKSFYNRKTGLYSECRSSSDSKNRFCNPDYKDSSSRNWESLSKGAGGRAIPFSLSD
jgi:hypothetical protein